MFVTFVLSLVRTIWGCLYLLCDTDRKNFVCYLLNPVSLVIIELLESNK